MKKILKLSTIILLLFSLNACINDNKQSFGETLKSKEDSVKFAETIMEKYSINKKVEFTSAQSNFKNINPTIRSFNPVDWDLIVANAGNYDTFPLGIREKGFMIDERGINFIKANDRYKRIYLRFGKRSNDPNIKTDYTVMIIPLDGTGKVLYKGVAQSGIGDDSNYDELDPCPSACPTDFDQP